jgi:hypothetical protein
VSVEFVSWQLDPFPGNTNMKPAQIIGSLNALHVGDIDVIRTRLDQARRACLELEQAGLARHLDEAEQALERADVRTYRKRVETVISQLGHLK